MTMFTDLALSAPLLEALTNAGYTMPTPIQAKAIPPALEGRDILGIAQTGTGKTAAFTLPILHQLATLTPRPHAHEVRALILTPTRELAMQIGESVRKYGGRLGLRYTVIFGGVGQKAQEDQMRRGMDIVVATPGRLLDLVEQKIVNLAEVKVCVLDEADRMLDMGFIHDVKKLCAKMPKERQNMLFSATMPEEIAGLAKSILVQPVRVEVTPVATTVDKIDQRIVMVGGPEKRHVLLDLLADKDMSRVILFTRTKHMANRVSEYLGKANISSGAIHGNKSQNARQAVLKDFRAGKARVLVATDIAARGIDIPDITHVINFELPHVPEDYVHRIGRTARAGKEGIAISLVASDEREMLRGIEKLTRRNLRVIDRPPVDPQRPVVEMTPDRGPPQDRRPRRHGEGAGAPKKSGGPATRGGHGQPKKSNRSFGQRSSGRR